MRHKRTLQSELQETHASPEGVAATPLTPAASQQQQSQTGRHRQQATHFHLSEGSQYKLMRS